jgi:hypothetical protein
VEVWLASADIVYDRFLLIMNVIKLLMKSAEFRARGHQSELGGEQLLKGQRYLIP